MSSIRDGSPENNRLTFLSLALIIVACVFVYRHAISFDFVSLDDDVNIFFNPHFGLPDLERIRWMFTDVEYVHRYLPLGWLGLSIVYVFSGLNPLGYHGLLIALHAANSALVFVLLRRFMKIFFRRPTVPESWTISSALLATLWWALNPLRVESVGWASGLLYAQAIFFCLVAAILYLGVYEEDDKCGRRMVYVILATLAYAASVLTYPIAIGVAPVLVWLDVCWIRRRYAGQTLVWNREARRLLLEKTGVLVAAATVLLITIYGRDRTVGPSEGIPSLETFPLVQRCVQAIYVLVYYLWKPWAPFNLTVIYSSLVIVDPWARRFWMSIVAAGLLLGAVTIWPRFRKSVGPFLVAHIFLMIPVLGLTEQPHITYDRYACFSTIVWAVALTLVLSQATARWQRGAIVAGAIPLLIVSALLSYRLSWMWENSFTLHRHIDRNLSDSAFPLFKYRRPAFILLAYGKYQEAEQLIQKGLEKFPDNEFLKKTQKELKERRDSYRALMGSTQGEMVPQAMIHVSYGLGFAREGKWAEAEEHYRCALELSPNYCVAAYNHALVLLQLGRLPEALHNYFEAESHAGPTLTPAHRRKFFQLLATRAVDLDNMTLAHAADRQVQRM